MDVLINELSLDGQFANRDIFLDNLEKILLSISLLDILKINLLKNHTFFNSQITDDMKFSEIANSKNDRIRRLKSYLLKLSNKPPYWNDTQVHNCSDSYIFNSKNICNTSLAESSQRDRYVLSFNHCDFLKEKIVIGKNKINIEQYNIIDNNNFLDFLLSSEKISPLEFCLNRYKQTKLDFTKLEDGYGFDILNENQTKEYLNSFLMFCGMSWEYIKSSDGLEYKQYKKPKPRVKGWFRKGLYANTDIFKFRITQEYRCFGYRDGNIYYVLRFELDHEISDRG